jgi:hypothetical protein
MVQSFDDTPEDDSRIETYVQQLALIGSQLSYMLSGQTCREPKYVLCIGPQGDRNVM